MINFRYSYGICGSTGILIGLFVSLKQLIPEQEFLFFTGLKIRAKQIPIIFGPLVAWTYLRFYQKKGNIKGDFNESFSFATFFPEAIQPPIKIVSNIVYRILTKLHMCQPGTGGNSSVLPMYNNNNSNNSFSQADIDRRRALAVKALEERMNQQSTTLPTTTNNSSSSTPTIANLPLDESQ
eukprot:gene1073-1359_t